MPMPYLEGLGRIMQRAWVENGAAGRTYPPQGGTWGCAALSAGRPVALSRPYAPLGGTKGYVASGMGRRVALGCPPIPHLEGLGCTKC